MWCDIVKIFSSVSKHNLKFVHALSLAVELAACKEEVTSEIPIPGGCSRHAIFNDVISAQGWVELPLHKRIYTWSNKQASPLLERLDWWPLEDQEWFLNKNKWDFEGFSLLLLGHSVILTHLYFSYGTLSSCTLCDKYLHNNSKSQYFSGLKTTRWSMSTLFIIVVVHGWAVPITQTASAKVLTAKFKNLRTILRAWRAQLSSCNARVFSPK
jgi:hypothetical protein